MGRMGRMVRTVDNSVVNVAKVINVDYAAVPQFTNGL